MARIGHQDYYKPTMLRNGQVCLPVRWFMHQISCLQSAGKCQPLRMIWVAPGVLYLMTTSKSHKMSFWRHFQSLKKMCPCIIVTSLHPQKFFVNCLISIQLKAYSTFLLDVFNPITHTQEPWTLTDPRFGNCWHALVQGSLVAAFPIWLYCDNTSGNLSKKWNEHNSFLFTAAGLPCAEAQKEFNVHFLSTSNLAPPLEMLDGVVDQLEYVMSFMVFIQLNLMNLY